VAIFKDDRAYNPETLTKVFLGASLALLFFVVLMVVHDYDRPWKHIQVKFIKMERVMNRAAEAEAKEVMDTADYQKAEADLQAAQQEVDAHQAAIRELEDKSSALDGKIYKATQVSQFQKAESDSLKYSYEEGVVRKGKPDPKGQERLDKSLAKTDDLAAKLFDLKQQQQGYQDQLKDLYAKQKEAQGKVDSLTLKYGLLAKKAKTLKTDWLFEFRNAPFLDFMSTTVKIQQVALDDLPEDLYYAKTMRVDRCTTCHLAIDKKGWEDAPEPFRTHPNLELYLGDKSPHPLEKIGCTICHGGVGQSVDFTQAAHTPNDEDQAKLWRKKYGWEPVETTQSPMKPLKYVEGACLNCHKSQEYVNHADKLNRGRELMVVRGCVGCHKVVGLENLPKAGPSLLRVRGKLKRDFVMKWVWAPTSFNDHAKMPSYFQQSNNSTPADLANTKAELDSIVTYLWNHSDDYHVPEAYPGGSVSKGKELFSQVGCLACHGIKGALPYHAIFAPDLSTVGSKLSPSFIYSWIRNPRHFNPTTRMPSLRLSVREAADLTAYLSSLKNPAFEKEEGPKADPAARDALIADYLKPMEGDQGALKKLAGMTEDQRADFLGRKSLTKYGCFGCHTIQGYENTPGIGTELSEWGTKQVSQLDFGLTGLEHAHTSFLEAKLANPRRFDDGVVKDFKDLLKMPNFNLSEEDRASLATAVLGLEHPTVPEEMQAGLTGNGPLLEKGRRVLNGLNCRGCHLIEDQGAKIRTYYTQLGEDFSLAPPNLRKEGAKVQIDWMHNFFLDVQPIRPWLKIRMPSFHWDGSMEGDLITYFNLKEDQVFPWETVDAPRLSPADHAQAQALFGKLQCQKCHMLGSQMPADLNSAAPDLLKVKSRLKPDWVVQWLNNPEALMPGTRMPGFWTESNPAPKYFHADSLKQRTALRDFLFHL